MFLSCDTQLYFPEMQVLQGGYDWTPPVGPSLRDQLIASEQALAAAAAESPFVTFKAPGWQTTESYPHNVVHARRPVLLDRQPALLDRSPLLDRFALFDRPLARTHSPALHARRPSYQTAHRSLLPSQLGSSCSTRAPDTTPGRPPPVFVPHTPLSGAPEAASTPAAAAPAAVTKHSAAPAQEQLAALRVQFEWRRVEAVAAKREADAAAARLAAVERALQEAEEKALREVEAAQREAVKGLLATTLDLAEAEALSEARAGLERGTNSRWPQRG